MIYTLGDVVTVAMVVIGVPIVLYKLAQAWIWPLVRPLIMLRAAEPTVRTTYEPAEPMAVLADTHQAEPIELGENEPPAEPLRLRQLPRQDLIVLLAVQRKEDGAYLFSANQITAFIGGTAAPVKALIAEVRAEREAAPKAAGRMERPPNGWPAKA